MSNPPPGWYDIPQSEGQGYWDGTGWTDGFQQGMETGGARPNNDAVMRAVLFGVVSFIGLLVVLNPHIDGTAAVGAGLLLVPAVVATALVGLVARSTSRYVGWWVYAVVVPTIAVVLASGLAGSLRVVADIDKSRGEALGLLSAPGAGHGWAVVNTPETRAEVLRITEGMRDQSPDDIDSVVAEFYTHESAPDTTVLFIGINGDMAKGRSAGDDLADLLAGSRVKDPQDFDPGDVGGALGCGKAAAQNLTWVTCGWIGRDRAVLVRWSDTSIEVEQAAELTRDFRERASR